MTEAARPGRRMTASHKDSTVDPPFGVARLGAAPGWERHGTPFPDPRDPLRSEGEGLLVLQTVGGSFPRPQKACVPQKSRPCFWALPSRPGENTLRTTPIVMAWTLGVWAAQTKFSKTCSKIQSENQNKTETQHFVFVFRFRSMVDSVALS